ncbi:hypothetical protein DFQ30_008600 [Apophysomyces sp. BC1015]|nr:hypothetical protein DFQ30_008600 [Apophysomyces sp. BC1015]KAG0175866.1 hypothetical protein DFQ29_006853 [Apophysomyces sp. BC1021]
MAFGIMGSHNYVDGSILLPINVLKMISILGIILLFAAIIGIIGAFFTQRQCIHIVYTVIVLIAFVYQISTAVIVYDQAAHTESWLSVVWAKSTTEYRAYAEEKFTCCGFSHVLDHPVPSSRCTDELVNSAPPCYDPLIHYVRNQLSFVYLVLFAALSIEILALCNVVTLLCARAVYQSRQENPISMDRLASNPEWIYGAGDRGGSSPTLVDSAISESLAKEDPADKKYAYHPRQY